MDEVKPLKGRDLKGRRWEENLSFFTLSFLEGEVGGGGRPPRVCTQSGRGSWVGVVGARVLGRARLSCLWS